MLANISRPGSFLFGREKYHQTRSTQISDNINLNNESRSTESSGNVIRMWINDMKPICKLLKRASLVRTDTCTTILARTFHHGRTRIPGAEKWQCHHQNKDQNSSPKLGPKLNIKTRPKIHHLNQAQCNYEGVHEVIIGLPRH